MSIPMSLPVPGWMSPANALTISRIVLSPALFYMILEAESTRGTSWAIFFVGWVFGLSDFLDGPLARRSGQVSRSGAFLDPFADKIVVLGVAFSFVAVDRLFWVPVALIAVREVAISIFRIYWVQQGLAVPAGSGAKLKTVVQGLALGMAALPPLEDDQLVVDIAIWIAVAVTLYTGWQYLRAGRSATSTTGALGPI